MAGLSVRGATASRDGRAVLEDVGLGALPGTVTAVLGEAGAGKTTLLCAVAGLLSLDRGAVLLDGADMTRTRGRRRGVAMLAPGTMLAAGGTVQAGLRRVVGRGDAACVERVAEGLGLGALLGRRVGGLSHGEALLALTAARLAVGAGTLCLLVDEAGMGLDAAGAARLWAALRARAAAGCVVVMATRDAGVAMAADQLVLLGGGRVLQAGSPWLVHAEPVDAACARLTGEANVLSGQVREIRAGGFAWVSAHGRFVQASEGGRVALGAGVTVSLRPERMALLRDGERADNEIEGVVGGVRWLGGVVRVEVGGLVVVVPAWGGAVPSAGEVVRVGWALGAGAVLG